MVRIISIANQKGGVGKTTTAINLSSALASNGKRVLLLDFDPQGNSGRGFGIEITSLRATAFDALIETLPMKSTIQKVDEGRLDLIPSNLRLASLDTYVQSHGIKDPFHMLKHALDSIKDEYDFIIIDCPPSLGLLNINAMVASTSILIPVQCEYFAMEGIAAILSSVSNIQKSLNPDLKIEGFLLTMYDARTSLNTEIAMEVRKLFKENTFTTPIPRNVSIPQSAVQGLPVTTFRPNSIGALAYFSLAREILDHE